MSAAKRWAVRLESVASSVVWIAHTTEQAALRSSSELSRAWGNQHYDLRHRWSFLVADGDDREPRYRTRPEAIAAAKGLVVDLPLVEPNVVTLTVTRPTAGREHPQMISASRGPIDLHRTRRPGSHIPGYVLTDEYGRTGKLTDLLVDLILESLSQPTTSGWPGRDAVELIAERYEAALDELAGTGTASIDLADIRRTMLDAGCAVQLPEPGGITPEPAAPTTARIPNDDQKDTGQQGSAGAATAGSAALDRAGLDLIDLDEIDEEDGGLDDGLHTRFTTPEGYVSRAEQARRRWQGEHDRQRLADHDEHALAENTRESYDLAWREFGGFCLTRSIADPLDATATDVRMWVHNMTEQGLRPSTINGRLSGIRWHFGRNGHPSPTSDPNVEQTLAASRRRLGTAQIRRKPLTLELLRKIVAGMPTTLNMPADHIRVRRDRALLLLGWAAARRASELSALNIGDFAVVGDPEQPAEPGGIRLYIARSKTDQEAAGSTISVPWAYHHTNSCPARALIAFQRHLHRRGHHDGPLFRSIDRHGNISKRRLSRQAINQIVKDHVELVGEEPAPYGSHSLRAGLVTELSERGASDARIQEITGHKSRDSLARYDRPTSAFKSSPLNGDFW